MIEMMELSGRVVKCPNFYWMPGMRQLAGKNLAPYRIVSDDYAPPESEILMDSYSDILPDLTDPATLGCLLALVREAWKDPTASTAATREADGNRGWVMDCWDPKSPLNGIGPFQSEAEALVAALETAT